MNLNELSLPVKLRLRTIEILLEHYGFVNRYMLSELHGIGIAAVSKDISTYKKLNGESCFYNPGTHRIEKLSNFKRIFA